MHRSARHHFPITNFITVAFSSRVLSFIFFLSLSLPNWIFGVIYLLCSKREERFKMISEKFDERLSVWPSVPKLALNARKPTESYANFIYQCVHQLYFM